jgi:ribonuclease HII
VAGIDEAGRGACAGPLVVAAVILDPGRLAGLKDIADSKALTPAAREEAYEEVTRTAIAWHRVIIPPGEIDARGLHVCNVAGMRRALAGLACTPQYVLTDGFPVRGLGVPALAMWKGDEVTACVAAASIVAKVTRDRIMVGLHERFPAYGFHQHKGYSTRAHMRALAEHGPCDEHRSSFANVIKLARDSGIDAEEWADESAADDIAGALPGEEAEADEIAGGLGAAEPDAGEVAGGLGAAETGADEAAAGLAVGGTGPGEVAGGFEAGDAGGDAIPGGCGTADANGDEGPGGRPAAQVPPSGSHGGELTYG